MKLIIYNGSPRGKNGNTEKLLDAFVRGFLENKKNECEILYLYKEKDKSRAGEVFKNSEYNIVAFPLYFDAMPSGVKSFIESLLTVRKEQVGGKKSIGYLVQSGFPEANHSRSVERYLEKLTLRLGDVYTGTIIKGAGMKLEIDSMDSIGNKKTLELFYRAGEKFGESGSFDPQIVTKIAGLEKLPGFLLLLLRLMMFLKAGPVKEFWDERLKQNNAFEKRFDRPYDNKG
ncbi:MAG: hypothetical protein GY754_27275 [bacterium]|nr:hypothetical protein [bacterium]